MTIADPITPIDIQYHLKKKGITQKQLAEQLQVSEMSISNVINFNMVSDRLMRAVADAIGMKPELVFAWYYHGERRRPRLFEASGSIHAA